MPTATIDLRNEQTAARLFTYPHDGHEDQGLGDTIRHYFNDGLTREGLAKFTIAPGGKEKTYQVQITVDDGQIAEKIRSRYQSFFDVGLISLRYTDAFWDGRVPPLEFDQGRYL